MTQRNRAVQVAIIRMAGHERVTPVDEGHRESAAGAGGPAASRALRSIEADR
jgi:hypothetical protein